ncbi:MAG: DMT family transporter [Spirochaetaceae bacterium]
MTQRAASSAESAPTNESSFLSLLFVAITAVFWGLSGGIGGVLIERDWNPFVVAFYRGFVGLLFFLLWLALRPRRSGMANAHMWFWAVLAGLSVAGNFSFYLISVAEGGVAVAATLMYCAPVFVYIASFALGLERSSPPKWAAIAFVLLGIVLLTGIYEVETVRVTRVGIAAGLLSGLSYAVFIFSFKSAARKGSPQSILAVAFATLCVTLIWPASGREIARVVTTSSWPLFVALGILGAGISFFLYIVGLRNTAPAPASIVAMVEPVTASIFGVFVLNEQIDAPQVVGMLLILYTVTKLSLYSSQGNVSIYRWLTAHAHLRKNPLKIRRGR